ncbi:putative histone chaperone domain chz [Erysiphe neolycopersici]|uniref:Putative histone chaperone domain chz n=1 Tax=Erysiphe neolycopersici TaxID=212602 RepID=A0A420HKU3_9PEZI|nr:putative histone chaperone domain chz [Erysiphe neolycopersici]
MSEQSAKSEETPISQDGKQIANVPINASVGATAETPTHDKGKGISNESTTHDISMDEDDSSSEDEAAEGGVDVIDEDALEEISLENIINGNRRTRGRNIDFVEAAKELGPDDEDEDEEDDDFEMIEDEEMKE